MGACFGVDAPSCFGANASSDWIDRGGAELEEPLAKEWVKLVRKQYLIELARSGGRLERRQELPLEAFIGLDELKRRGGPLPVVVLSYPWLQPGHPDPFGENLQVIARGLDSFFIYADGVLIDFTALPQEPRTAEEDEAFKLGLRSLNIFYSHPQTHVMKITQFPPGYPDHPDFRYVLPEGSNRLPYHERGWCFAESAMSGLVKPSSFVRDVSQMSGVTGVTMQRPVPLRPDAFRVELDKKTFTSKNADFEKVAQIYEDAFELRFGSAEQLLYSDLGWGADDARRLLRALAAAHSLRKLCLDDNRMGPEGATALAEGLRNNATLQWLDLGGNGAGTEGAVALGQMLQTNNTLQVLTFRTNDMGDEGAAAFGLALERNSSLQRLRLSENRIASRGATALSRALQANHTLRVLDLDFNPIGDEGAVALAEAVRSSSSLQELNLCGSSIGSEGRAALQQAEQVAPTCNFYFDVEYTAEES